MEYKMVILIRSDLKLPKGKACAQAAHAAVECALKSSASLVREWHRSGQKKVILKVDDKTMLIDYLQKARKAKIITGLITDAGKTVVAPGTVTCVGIGPADESLINTVTGDLKMY